MDIMSTGCHAFDRVVRGGFPVGHVSLIYGEAGTGKTTIAIQCAVNCAIRRFKTLFIDADNTFPPARLAQIAQYDLDTVSPQILVFTPQKFKEQIHLIENLDSFLTPNVALIVVDTITSLYRVELGSSEEIFALNRELNRQLAYLVDIAKAKKVAVLLISQVHGVMSESTEVEPVAMRILNFQSKIIVKLRKTSVVGVVEAILEKFLDMKHPQTNSKFKLTETGIQDVKR